MKVTCTTAKERTYIPSCLKNKKQPESERIRVVYSTPTSKMKEDLLAVKMSYVQDENGKTSPNMSINISKFEIISKMLIRIDNFIYVDKDDPTKETVVTGVDELFNAPTDSGAIDLIDELYKVFMEVLNGKAISEKN